MHARWRVWSAAGAITVGLSAALLTGCAVAAADTHDSSSTAASSRHSERVLGVCRVTLRRTRSPDGMRKSESVRIKGAHEPVAAQRGRWAWQNGIPISCVLTKLIGRRWTRPPSRTLELPP